MKQVIFIIREGLLNRYPSISLKYMENVHIMNVGEDKHMDLISLD